MDDFIHLAARQGGPGGPGAMSPPPPIPLSANPFAAIIAITVIMFLIVTAKVAVKGFIAKQVGWDDASALVGALFVVAITGILGSIFAEAGLTSSTAVVSPGQIQSPAFATRLFVFLLISAVPSGFAKLSILLLLYRIFPRSVRPVAAYFIIAGIAIVLLFYSILVLYTGIHCGPYNAQPCSVDTQVNLAKASASINLFLDLYVLIIAVVNVWMLHMSLRHKLGVSVIFGTGLAAVACSIVVLYYRVVTTEDPRAAWVQVLTPLVLVIYEPSIALITASLPSAPSLWGRLSETGAWLSVRHLLSRLTSASSGSDDYTQSPFRGTYELRDQPSQDTSKSSWSKGGTGNDTQIESTGPHGNLPSVDDNYERMAARRYHLEV